MNSLAYEPKVGKAFGLSITDDALTVDLLDGRTISVPLGWYPRLLHGSPAERAHWRFIQGGEGIHWPDLDEDISVEGLVLGRPSGEGQASLERWLRGRSES
ncbi:MAG TPA: DUF2442 domain-containing protein [Thermoanaerobaculia bacterium]|jgi:hypothetical protein|nr:DUF2442 domain-containing protein [Thermoanaerobaculia bacterium]